MKIAIVAYPRLDEADHQWIESFRSKHDPQAGRIRAHFTLVFPVDADPIEIDPEVAAAAAATPPISFVIRVTRVVPDTLANVCHVFLVPDEGGAQIRTLHGRLYGGALGVYRRSDIPFTPHVTVAAAPERRTAEQVAAAISFQSREVPGTIERIEIVNADAMPVQTLARYDLKGTTLAPTPE